MSIKLPTRLKWLFITRKRKTSTKFNKTIGLVSRLISQNDDKIGVLLKKINSKILPLQHRTLITSILKLQNAMGRFFKKKTPLRVKQNKMINPKFQTKKINFKNKKNLFLYQLELQKLFIKKKKEQAKNCANE